MLFVGCLVAAWLVCWWSCLCQCFCRSWQCQALLLPPCNTCITHRTACISINGTGPPCVVPTLFRLYSDMVPAWFRHCTGMMIRGSRPYTETTLTLPSQPGRCPPIIVFFCPSSAGQDAVQNTSTLVLTCSEGLGKGYAVNFNVYMDSCGFGCVQSLFTQRQGTCALCAYHLFATSFGTTRGVAHASCKCMPLRHLNTDVFVSAFRVLSTLLRKHEW